MEFLFTPDLAVSAALAVCIRKFGMDFLDWDPQVRFDNLCADLKVQKLPQRLQDKYNCGATLVGTNGYTQRLEIFVPCNMVMSQRPFQEGSMGLDDPYSLAWGVWEFRTLMEDDPYTLQDDSEQFTEDIAIYCGEVLMMAGLSEAPSWLSFAQFNQVKLQNLSENMIDPEGYMSNQIGMKNEITAYVEARRDNLVKQLKEVDRLYPIRGTER